VLKVKNPLYPFCFFMPEFFIKQRTYFFVSKSRSFRKKTEISPIKAFENGLKSLPQKKVFLFQVNSPAKGILCQPFKIIKPPKNQGFNGAA
jgi:hypothetical protein